MAVVLNWTMSGLPFCRNKTFTNDSQDSPLTWYHDPRNDSWTVSYGAGVFLIGDAALTATWSCLANLIVIVAFCRDPKLRSVQNYYIVGLATSDVLMGTLVLPIGTYSFLYNESWPLQSLALCKFWESLDYVCSLQSTLSVCLISYDRFQMVLYPVDYRTTETPKRAVTRILATWTFSVVFYGPVCWFWDVWQGCTTNPPGKCEMEFDDVVWITAIQAVVEFAIPLVIIGYCNIRLMLYIHRRSRRLNSTQMSGPATISIAQIDSIFEPHTTTTTGHRSSIFDSSEEKKFKTAEGKELRKDQKAARSLMILVGVYFVLWFWYEIVGNFVRPICPDCVSTQLYQASYWPQYHIAALNPLIYAITIDRFRYHFLTVFSASFPCCWRYSPNKRLSVANRKVSVTPYCDGAGGGKLTALSGPFHT